MAMTAPWLITVLALTLPAAVSALAAAPAHEWVRLPEQENFTTVLRYPDRAAGVAVATFELMARPVTNGDFLAFVQAHSSWRRDRIPALFAETRYLEHWPGPTDLDGQTAQPGQPVTQVSWFAADAYCRHLGARLPTWTEWEYAAAADEHRHDARADPAWRERILTWYARPSNRPLPMVGQGPANAYGVHDLHGLVWEWVDDHGALLVSADNREQGDPDLLAFCGAGALSTEDRENYAVLMRIALLSALDADDVTGNLGFRCARDPTGVSP
jgi:formylglycine-generating enzyme